MKVRASDTARGWLEQKDRAGLDSDTRDEATERIYRALSDLIRCQNLVVLAGLGTSSCVRDQSSPPKSKAPTMIGLWDRVKSAYDPENEGAWSALLKQVKHDEHSTNIEELLSACKVAEVFFDGESLTQLRAFITLAEREIHKAVDFLSDTDVLATHGTFLQRIARRSAGKSRAKIFTTNYDLCFERAAKDGRFIVIDGFSSTLPPTFDPVFFTYDIVRRLSGSDASAFIPNVFHLYKLHGSIDWERQSSGIEKKHKTDKPLLIYPRSSKYEQAFSPPYLEMMSAFQASLRDGNCGLLVVGFGFNDTHIAEPIVSSVRSNLGLKVVVVDPLLDSSAKINENEYLQNLQSLMDAGDARLSFVSGTFEDVAHMIPDMVAETDLEKHMVRMRGLRGDS